MKIRNSAVSSQAATLDNRSVQSEKTIKRAARELLSGSYKLDSADRIAPVVYSSSRCTGRLSHALEKCIWRQCRFRFNLQEGAHDAGWTPGASSSFAQEGCPGARLTKVWVLTPERRFEPLRVVPKNVS